MILAEERVLMKGQGLLEVLTAGPAELIGQDGNDFRHQAVARVSVDAHGHAFTPFWKAQNQECRPWSTVSRKENYR